MTVWLDVSVQARIILLLQDLQRSMGATYVFISNDLGPVRYFWNCMVVVYLGAVVEELRDPSSAPRHPYTATLINSTFAPDPRRARIWLRWKGKFRRLSICQPVAFFLAVALRLRTLRVRKAGTGTRARGTFGRLF
ncbi:MAG: hypothetical protein INF50_04925 [Rhodobacter sp.]|nr:hypothetical protein [Rhodobacter sp.]